MTRIRQLHAFALCAAMVLGACGSDEPEQPEAAGAAVAAAPPAAEAATAAERPAAAGPRGTGDVLAYAEIEGALARGYLAYPVDMIEPLPAVLLIHDWFGLDDAIRGIADQLAGQGYVVLAVDLFDGRTGTLPKDTRDALVRILEKPELTRSNLEQAMTFVREHVGSPRLAVLGFGSGGLWAMNAALAQPDEFRSVVLVQGQTLTDVDRLGVLNMPVLGIYGAGDRSITADEVRAFGDALTDADVTHEIRLYPAAGNAFMIDGSRNYSPSQAATAWQLIHEFLDEHLAISSAE